MWVTTRPLPGSPAVDAGDPGAAAGVGGVPASDERGAPFTRVFGGRIDMGAVEIEPAGFLAGDYNFDGVVDGADYSMWRDTMGSMVPAGSGADGNGDGVVDQQDYDVWRTNFGATLPAAGAASIAVTQPLRATAAAGRPGVNAALFKASPLESSPSKPPVDPEAGYPAGAAKLLAARMPFDAAARQDLLFEAWLATEDHRPPQDDDAESRLPGHTSTPNDSADDVAAVLDSAFALLGNDEA